MATECLQCKKAVVRRIRRQGQLEHLLSVFYLFPFRCQLCSRRFRAFKWGRQYVRQPVDRRQYQRLATNFPVSFSWEQVSGEGIATNISLGGCKLETNVQLVQGALLQLQLQVPGCEPEIQVEAAVVRTIQSESVGVQFLQLTESEKKRLGRFVLELLAAERNSPTVMKNNLIRNVQWRPQDKFSRTDQFKPSYPAQGKQMSVEKTVHARLNGHSPPGTPMRDNKSSIKKRQIFDE